MKIDALPENAPTKKIVRQEADYEAAGLDGTVTLTLPFDESCVNADALTSRGFSVIGVVRGLNQLFAENVGNLWGSKVRNAVKNGVSLPTEEDFNALVAAYDFSGARAASEAGMPTEERLFRSQLKQQLRRLLKGGTFSPNGEPLTVQTSKQAEEGELPDGKMALEDFESLIEIAIEGEAFQYMGREYDFSGEPAYDDEGNFANFAAVVDFARDLAEKEMELRKAASDVKPSMPK